MKTFVVAAMLAATPFAAFAATEGTKHNSVEIAGANNGVAGPDGKVIAEGVNSDMHGFDDKDKEDPAGIKQ